MADQRLQRLLEHPSLWRAGKHATDARFSPRAIATGHPQLDRHLPGGGWPAQALTEIVVDHQGLGELSLLMPTLARLSHGETHPDGWIVWIAPPHIPYAPALANWDIDLSRVLMVHSGQERDAGDTLWAMEQALRSGNCAAVLAWIGDTEEKALRRIQLAAEEGDSWAVLFRSPEALSQISPAALRLHLSSGTFGVNVHIVKCRGGRPTTIPGYGLEWL